MGCLAAFVHRSFVPTIIHTFINKTNSYRISMIGAHEAPIRMVLPLIFLGIGSLFAGYIGRDMFIGLGSPIFGNSVTSHIENVILVDSEFISPILKSIPLFCTIVGAILAWILAFRTSEVQSFNMFKTKMIPI